MDTFPKDLIMQTLIRNSAPSSQMQAQIQRRNQFKQYLLETGVQYELARCLRLLYQEPVKPRDPIDFIVKHIEPPRISVSEYRRLYEKLQVYLHRIKELEAEMELFQVEMSERFEDTDSEEFPSTSILCPSPSPSNEN